MDSQIPFAVRRAASKFHAHRAQYYAHLSWSLNATRGETKILTFFERDAERYPKKPRGILGAYWSNAYANNGGDLAETWAGTLPDDEVSIIRVAQAAGKGALEVALGDVARVAALGDKIKKAVFITMLAGLLGLLIAGVMTTIYPIFATKKLQEIYSFIPLDQWGPKGVAFNEYAERVKKYGGYVLGTIVFVVLCINWSINNWTGEWRNWADKNIVLYKAVRDIKGALFLATMATLTRKRGNVSLTLRDSLSLLSESIKSKWLRWRIDEIIERVNQTGAVGSDSFETHLLSEDMFYLLRDTQEALGFSEGFIKTGQYVESEMSDAIVGRMSIYRWIFLFVAILGVIGVVGMQFGVIYEMKGVMAQFYSAK